MVASVMGQTRPKRRGGAMSAFPPIATELRIFRTGRFVPASEVNTHYSIKPAERNSI
jgi:hypothetical protein